MRHFALIAAFALAGCSRPTATQPDTVVAPSPAAVPTPSAGDTAAFAPLGSAQVKDAIHRALVTGETQRWQDGSWSGYAVPSQATLANGCRTIRYTIDQQPDAPPATINACDASRTPSPPAP